MNKQTGPSGLHCTLECCEFTITYCRQKAHTDNDHALLAVVALQCIGVSTSSRPGPSVCASVLVSEGDEESCILLAIAHRCISYCRLLAISVVIPVSSAEQLASHCTLTAGCKCLKLKAQLASCLRSLAAPSATISFSRERWAKPGGSIRSIWSCSLHGKVMAHWTACFTLSSSMLGLTTVQFASVVSKDTKLHRGILGLTKLDTGRLVSPTTTT